MNRTPEFKVGAKVRVARRLAESSRSKWFDGKEGVVVGFDARYAFPFAVLLNGDELPSVFAPEELELVEVEDTVS